MITADKQSVDLTQKYFRVMLDSMSKPGKVFKLPFVERDKNPLFTLLFTLLDNEVTFSVIGNDVQETFIETVFSITKAKYVSACDADYVIVSGQDSMGYLKNVFTGTLECPDKGACIIYPVENLNPDVAHTQIILSGPGVKSKRLCALGGVKKDDLKLIKEINSDFPLGIDIIFIDAKGVIVSIPRSSKIAMEEL